MEQKRKDACRLRRDLRRSIMLSDSPYSGLLFSHVSTKKGHLIEVHSKDFRLLKENCPINSTIIDFYLILVALNSHKTSFGETCFPICARSVQDIDFQSPKIAANNITNNPFHSKLILIPIFQGPCHDGHWLLCTYNTVSHQFRIYNSIVSTNNSLTTSKLLNIKMFIFFLHKKFLGAAPDLTAMQIIYKECPQQQKGCKSCGIFVLKTAEYLSYKFSISFNPEYMDVYRRDIQLKITRNSI